MKDKKIKIKRTKHQYRCPICSVMSDDGEGNNIWLELVEFKTLEKLSNHIYKHLKNLDKLTGSETGGKKLTVADEIVDRLIMDMWWIDEILDNENPFFKRVKGDLN